MPRPRSDMRRIRSVLRLTLGQRLSLREAGGSLGMPPTTVADYVTRAKKAGLSWPLPDDMDDAALERRLFVLEAKPPTRPLPDWLRVHKDLRNKDVTLTLLWYEYRQANPDVCGSKITSRCSRGLPEHVVRPAS